MLVFQPEFMHTFISKSLGMEFSTFTNHWLKSLKQSLVDSLIKVPWLQTNKYKIQTCRPGRLTSGDLAEDINYFKGANETDFIVSVYGRSSPRIFFLEH